MAASLWFFAGCGTPANRAASGPSMQAHHPAQAGGASALQNRHILLQPLPKGVRTTADLWNWLLDEKLAQMDNPSQGEICLDAACKVAATVFSGPSKARAGEPLALIAFQPRSGWHVLVGPMPQSADPPKQAQAFYASLRGYPRPQGVCVVEPREIDWYWIEAGHLQVMRQPRS